MHVRWFTISSCKGSFQTTNPVMLMVRKYPCKQPMEILLIKKVNKTFSSSAATTFYTLVPTIVVTCIRHLYHLPGWLAGWAHVRYFCVAHVPTYVLLVVVVVAGCCCWFTYFLILRLVYSNTKMPRFTHSTKDSGYYGCCCGLTDDNNDRNNVLSSQLVILTKLGKWVTWY